MAIVIWLGGDLGNENDWSVGANWSTSSVPTDGDVVYIRSDGSPIFPILDGLNQSAITLAELNIEQSFTGAIGTLADYLQISTDILRIGLNVSSQTSQGSGRIKLDLGTNASTVYIYNSAQSATEVALQPIRLLGTNAGNILYHYGGRASIANAPGETSEFDNIVLGNTSSTPDLIIGQGCVYTTIFQKSGRCVSQDDLVSPNKTGVSITMTGGTLYTYGATTFASLSLFNSGANFIRRGTGTATLLVIGDGGIFDGSQESSSMTITDCTMYNGSVLNLKNGVANSYTFSNPIDISTSNLQNSTILLEPGEHVQLS